MRHRMGTYSIKFSGRILERGFWLYVIDIHAPRRRFLYVGRTGDSSSANAASPFSRIGRHLDRRPKAKGNALARNLAAKGVTPSTCSFEMIAVGPIFAEAKDFDRHKPIRDKTAALERGLAEALRRRGYSVLGSHATSPDPDRAKLEIVLRAVESALR